MKKNYSPYALRFLCNILANTCYRPIFRSMAIRDLGRFQTAEVTFKVTQGHYY